MITIYKALNLILYPIAVLIIFVRKILNKEHHSRYKEKIFSSSFKSFAVNNKLYWFHAASVGELMSIIPLIKKLGINNNLNFLVTTITNTSANVAEKEFSEIKNIHHRFLPIDNPILVKKFIYGWKPNAAFFVDSEIWPNFIFEIKNNGIPLILINARITKKTYDRWMLLSKFAKELFNNFDLCLVSNSETKKYLEILSKKKIKFIGNLKYSIEVKDKILINKNLNKLNNYSYWCAASTHHPEENFCLEVHSLIKVKKNILTIIIPRHITRSKEISKLCINKKLNFQILGVGDEIKDNIDILIVNSFGQLSQFFKSCDSVFIGKSLVKKYEDDGGQNPIEAVKQGCKVYHGPYIKNFKDIYDELKSYNVGEKVVSPEDLSTKLIEDFDNKNNIKKYENAKKVSEIGNKILNDTMDEINDFISS